MKKVARITSIVLLILLGISALIGAYGLVGDPSGKSAQLPEDLLDSTPFRNYLVPGLLLGIFNGLLSLAIAVLVIIRARFHEWIVIFQGCVLIVWLTVEVMMGIYLPAMTLPYYVIGILLIVCGSVLRYHHN